MDLEEEELQSLYSWVDEIPLSRPKRNIARDFSDGVLVAELVLHYFPKLVELHNYSAANSLQQKLYNWSTLNNKVFRRLGFTISRSDCDAVANAQPGAIERVLKLLRARIASYSATPSKVRAADVLPSPARSAGMAASMLTEESLRAQQRDHQQYTPPAGMLGKGSMAIHGSEQQLLAERGQTICELKETNEILQAKVRKLEQLVKLKDAKVQTLMSKLQAAGLV